MQERLRVEVVRAENVLAKDANGTSDPYCVLEMNGVRHKTKVVSNTLNPEWMAEFSFNLRDTENQVLSLDMYDHDFGLKKDDFLGQVHLALSDIRRYAQGDRPVTLPLQKRTAKSNVRGDVVLLFSIVQSQTPLAAAERGDSSSPCSTPTTDRKQTLISKMLRRNKGSSGSDEHQHDCHTAPNSTGDGTTSADASCPSSLSATAATPALPVSLSLPPSLGVPLAIPRTRNALSSSSANDLDSLSDSELELEEIACVSRAQWQLKGRVVEARGIRDATSAYVSLSLTSDPTHKLHTSTVPIHDGCGTFNFDFVVDVDDPLCGGVLMKVKAGGKRIGVLKTLGQVTIFFAGIERQNCRDPEESEQASSSETEIKSVPEKWYSMRRQSMHTLVVGTTSNNSADTDVKVSFQLQRKDTLRVDLLDESVGEPAETEMPPEGSVEAPVADLEMMLIDHVFPCSLLSLYRLLFARASPFQSTFMKASGYVDIKVGDWANQNRQVEYVRPLPPNPLGKKTAHAIELQQCTTASKFSAVVDVTSTTPEMPYGTSFQTDLRYILVHQSPSSVRLRLSFQVVFTKSTLMKGVITKSTIQGVKETFVSFEKMLKASVSGTPIDPTAFALPSAKSRDSDTAHSADKCLVTITLTFLGLLLLFAILLSYRLSLAETQMMNLLLLVKK